MFLEGELIDQSTLGMSGVECVTLSSSGRWLGVASREDRNIVLFELGCE